MALTSSWIIHITPALMKVKVTQLCPTLCDPMDYTVHGIIQTRILERVAIPFSRGSFQPRIKPAEPPGKPSSSNFSIIISLMSLIICCSRYLQNWERTTSRLYIPCLFNFYAEYIMQDARLYEPQARIKSARRNISNLRY